MVVKFVITMHVCFFSESPNEGAGRSGERGQQQAQEAEAGQGGKAAGEGRSCPSCR